MDLINACKILEIDDININETIIKTAYYKYALKYHPDKNNDVNSVNRFVEIKEAYDYLNTYLSAKKDKEDEIEETDNSYFSTLVNLFSLIIGKDISIQLISEFLFECKNNKEYKTELFDRCDTILLKKIYNILLDYVDDINVDTNILHSIREKIENNLQTKNKFDFSNETQQTTFIILKPTINNLLNADVYKLEYENEIFYIPLWHDEIDFEYNNKKITVKCIPELDENIFISPDNSLHISVKININSIFFSEFYKIEIGEKVFEINLTNLKLKNYQTSCLYNKGIPVINNKDFYSIQKKSNIYLHITLEK